MMIDWNKDKLGSIKTDHSYSAEQFKSQFVCDFKPDERLIALDDKLTEYYKESDELGNHAARYLYSGFTSWRKNNGYTADEVNKAKQRVLGSVRFQNERYAR
jgi:hypothetical protein